MTAPVRGTPQLSAAPATQNAAPVAEFRCLFTHDVRRKQKRWQDGYLKFHSFNNRVMVYDTARNFIGETYWKGGGELQEGDELNLDRPVMVQVEDAIGVTQTDLTPLFEKKTKETPRPKVSRIGPQLRHKPLNALLGTPKGALGKAVSMRSPYEARTEKENEWAAQRAAKRQKTARSSVDLASSSPVRPDNTAVNDAQPLRARIVDAKKVTSQPRPLSKATAVINLESDPDYISSDLTLPNTPPTMERARPQHVVISVPAPEPKPTIPTKPPVQIPSDLPRPKIRLPKPVEVPRPLQPSSPPVSVANRVCMADLDFQPAVQPVAKPAKKPVRNAAKQPSSSVSPPRESKPKSLRLSTGHKRGMLLCQAGPRRVPNCDEAPKPPPKRRKTKEVSVPDPPRPDPVSAPSDDELLQSMPEEVEAISGQKKIALSANKAMTPAKKPGPRPPSPQSSSDAFEDMEVVQGIMDAQLMVSPSPPRQDELAISKSSAAHKTTNSKATAPKTVSRKQAKLPQSASPEPGPVPNPRKQKPTRKASETQPTHNICTPTTTTTIARPSKQPLAEPQHNSPASASPRKVPLSTSGFNRKPKPQATTTTEPTELHPQRRPFPPRPLQARKPGSLMTTAELSSILQHDPIEDADDSSPTRRLKRVHSANDAEAPIPSTTGIWEQSNLRHNTDKAPADAASDASTTAGVPSRPKVKAGGLKALCGRTDPRKKFQRTASLNVGTGVGAEKGMEMGMSEGLGSVALEPVDADKGPWSTEAFDLFDWRPPAKEGGQDRRIGMLVDS